MDLDKREFRTRRYGHRDSNQSLCHQHSVCGSLSSQSRNICRWAHRAVYRAEDRISSEAGEEACANVIGRYAPGIVLRVTRRAGASITSQVLEECAAMVDGACRRDCRDLAARVMEKPSGRLS